MLLNLKKYYAIAGLGLASLAIVGCGNSNGSTSSTSTTTSQLNSGGSSNTSGSSSSSGSSSTTSSNNGGGQSPPAGAQVIANIQNQSGWQTCGGCGNNGGTGIGPSYGVTQSVSSPSLSGGAANFWINGGPAFSGGYYFIEQPTVPNPVSYLRYEFDLYLPAQYASAPQALEFECQQNSNGYTYNYAWQADYDSKTWRVFNFTNKNWESSGITFSGFAGDTWHHIIAIYHASGTQTIHDSLTVDGTTYPVNLIHNALFTGNGLEFTNAFQVDLNGSSTPYQVYVDNMTVTRAD
jgi:hypothetical protein